MWDGQTFQMYYANIPKIVSERLAQEDAVYLRQVDFVEFLDHLVCELEKHPLEWDESGWTVEAFTVKVSRRSELGGQTYAADEDRFRLRVPISKHPQRHEYFAFGPSTSWANQPEPRWKFEDDVLVHEVAATVLAVQQGKDAIRFWLGNRNKDIADGNRLARDRVRSVWEPKRRQLEEQHGQTEEVLKKLDIALHRDPNAPVKPVEIKPRQLRTVVQKPTVKATPAEPTLRREDVINLVTFIEEYARQFETAPKTYAKMDEEDLRDALIGMINTNYPGSTTGETFRKLGKTDISLRVENGHVLVSECKFWSGPKAYSEALEQLFGYLTWRENHGVLIHFCRLKDVSHAVAEGKRAIAEHMSFSGESLLEVSETRFISHHSHPQDAQRSLEVHHVFFDLSV